MIDDRALQGLEADVGRALERGDAAGLRVLGYGEISLVLGSPADEPRWACKRLPPFPSTAAADRYTAVFGRYLDEIGRRGIHVIETEIGRVALPDGRVALYCVQPVLPADSLATAIVARGGDAAAALLGDIVDATLAVVDERVGLDAQLSNWAVCDGRLTYFDVTTPMLAPPTDHRSSTPRCSSRRCPGCCAEECVASSSPGILNRYHDRRTVILDLAANLIKERLESWIPTVLEAAGDRLDPPLTVDEVRRDYRSDARTWKLLQAVRRADRSWQRTIRRRPYPFLLPDPIER